MLDDFDLISNSFGLMGAVYKHGPSRFLDVGMGRKGRDVGEKGVGCGGGGGYCSKESCFGLSLLLGLLTGPNKGFKPC